MMIGKITLMQAANRGFFLKVASGMLNTQINHENHNFLKSGTTFEKTITIMV